MDVRGKLIELLIGAGNAVADKYLENMGMSYAEQKRTEADYLISHGVTITPAVPGPSESDPNIMELCFRNGERHMKEKVVAILQDVLDQANGFCIIDGFGVIKAVEDL